MPERLARKLLLIGWDAADWQMIDPLIEQGKMPTLARLIEQGVMGNIATLRPILSPMLWTSIATGKRADKHGIHGFIEPRADGQGIQSVSSTSRKCKAVWNILSQNAIRSNVVGWYASHPAEPIDGVCVSEHLGHLGAPGRPLPHLSQQSVHPASLHDRVTELRVGPDEITAHHIAPFVPSLGEIPVEETPPITGIQKMLSRAATVQAVATDLLMHEPADFTAVYFEAIDHFGHAFMKYHPPLLPGIDPAKFGRYKLAMEGIYRFHDMMLERQLQLAGEDATIMLISDHGFLNDHLRPVRPDGTEAGPEAWHRHHGIFVLKGPGILKDERIYGATLLDIAPTLLHLFGLPVGMDMDGKVLMQCFESPRAIERIESWDQRQGPRDAGLHPPELQVDPFDQQAALQQLVELGYIAPPSEDHAKAIALAQAEAQFNLATVHLDAGRSDLAAKLLESLCETYPDERRYRGSLIHAHFKLGKFAEIRKSIESAGDAKDRPAQLNMLLGAVEAAEDHPQMALELLGLAEQTNPRQPALHCQIGILYLSLREWDNAARAFEKALAIDRDSAMAHYGLGHVALHRADPQRAIESLLRAVGLMHYFPRAHLYLGVALARAGMLDKALAALKVAVSQRHAMPGAHRLMAMIYAKLQMPDDARRHSEISRVLRERIAASA